MTQTKPNMEVSTLASSSASMPSCASSKYRRLSGRLRWQDLQCRLRLRFWATMYIWKSAFGSLVGHIRSQSTKEPPHVDFGPALVRDHAGCLRPCIRTHARAEYIKAVLAMHPQADMIDLQMFLEGFDAGEQWTLYRVDKESDMRLEPGSWLASVEHIPSKIIQLSKEVNGQISDAIPAAIAGVTRKDECTRQKL